VHEPADVGGQLLGFRARQHHAVVQGMQEALLTDPAPALHQLGMHEGDLPRRAAKADQAQFEPKTQCLPEADGVGRRRDGGLQTVACRCQCRPWTGFSGALATRDLRMSLVANLIAAKGDAALWWGRTVCLLYPPWGGFDPSCCVAAGGFSFGGVDGSFRHAFVMQSVQHDRLCLPLRMRLTPVLLALIGAACLSTAPGATATPAPLALGFSDFFVQPIGPRGLQPTAQLLAASGHEVRLVGFMVQRELPLAGQFFLTPRPVAMAEHADGEADDLPASTVTVVLPESQRDRVVAHQSGPIALAGRLEWGPAEDATGRVSWIRLYLAPGALAGQPAVATALHPH